MCVCVWRGVGQLVCSVLQFVFFIHRVLVTWYFQESLCELSCKIKSVYSGLFFFFFFQRAKYVHNNIFDLNCELF